MPSELQRFGVDDPQAVISQATLTRLAQRAGAAGAAVSSWTFEPVQGGFGGAIGGTALYRFHLSLDTGQSLSLILKVLFQRPGETPQSPYYWKREYEIYRAGILDGLPAVGFCMPRIYQLDDHGRACWIWMQDIADHRAAWTLADYADLARRLGHFNGQWLTGHPLPQAAWLAHNWHAAIVPALSDTFVRLEQLLAHPLARVALPDAAKDEIMAIWRDRQLFVKALAGLPRTFCHFDAFRRNVLSSGDKLTLIDWALAGIGGPGEDLVSLVAVSLYYQGYTEAYAIELDEQVFAGYMRGLQEAGWHGDRRLARLGYTCGMTLRGLAGVKQDLGMLLDAGRRDEVLAIHEQDSLEAIASFFADIRRFRLLRMAREARSLLAG